MIVASIVLLLIPCLLLLALIIGLAVAAERSLRRQRGSMLRRGKSERDAMSRVVTKHSRWPPSGGV